MRATALRIVCGFSLIFIGGCQAQGGFTQADLDAAEAEVTEVMEAFWEAWMAASFDEGMAYYADDPDLNMITDGFLWESKAQAAEAYRDYFEGMDRQEGVISETRVRALTPTVVEVVQVADFTQYFKDGQILGNQVYAMSWTWVKEGGSWKAVTMHNSMAAPTPASMRSLHLLNAPSAADEEAYVLALSAFNLAIKDGGYPGNGYDLWKLGEQDPEYASVGAGLVLEGSWADQEAYDAVHALDVYENIAPETTELFQRVSAGQRYTRYVRIPVGGPGEG